MASHRSFEELYIVPALHKFEKQVRQDIAQTQVRHLTRDEIATEYPPERIAQLLEQASRSYFRGFSQAGWDRKSEDARIAVLEDEVKALEQKLTEASRTIRVLHQFDTRNAVELGKVKQQLARYDETMQRFLGAGAPALAEENRTLREEYRDLERELEQYKPICLNCGAEQPCMTEADLKPGDPGIPCTFDPTPKELFNDNKRLRQELALEREKVRCFGKDLSRERTLTVPELQHQTGSYHGAAGGESCE